MNLFDLFATINLDTSGYEQGLNDAEESTSSFGDKLKGGLSKASSIAVGAVGAITAAGTALTGTMVKGASDLAVYGDEIDKASQKMGISAQAYQEWDAILQHSGASIGSLQASMRTLAKATEEGSDAFEQLGISQEELESLNTEDLFARVISGLQEMGEGSERTVLATQLLGRGAVELGALLNTSAEDTEAMRLRVHELGGVLSDEAVKSSAAFQDNLQDMKTAFSGIKNGIMSDMLPGITSLMAGFTSLIAGEKGAEDSLKKGFDSVFQNIKNGIKKFSSIGKSFLPVLVQSIVDALPEMAESAVDIITTIGEIIVENAPALIEAALNILQTISDGIIENIPLFAAMITQVISEIALMLSNPDTLTSLLTAVLTILQTIATSIVENIPTLVETAMMVINNILTFITTNLPMFIDVAIQIIMALMNGLIEALPALLGYLPTIINSLVTTLLSMLPLLVDAGVKLLVALVQNLPLIIRTIVAKMPEIITSVIRALTDMIPELVAAGVTLLTSLIDNLPVIITTIVEALPQIITSVVNGLLGMIPQIVEAGVTLLTSLITNLPEIIVEIVSSLPEIISAIVDGIIGAVPQLITAGGDLIRGLWQGISNVGEWLREKISGFFGGVVSSIKKFFGIASPSKVFAGIGEMLDRGLAKGVEEYAGLAVDAAEDMAEGVYDATNKNYDFTATGNVDSQGNPVGRWNAPIINVYGAEGQDVDELAEIVSEKIAFTYNQEQAVWA